MKLSTRTRYGVRLMLELALNYGKGYTLLKDVARNEEISEKYLSLIIIPLKARGLVTTFRGARGGYTLSRPAADITLKQIIEAIEGEISLVDCTKNIEICSRNTSCVTRDIWCELGDLIGDYLQSWSLARLAAKFRDKNGDDAHSYTI